LTEELENPANENDESGGNEKRIAALERLLAEKDETLATAEGRASELEAKLTLATDELAGAVAGYRRLMIRLHPEVPEDLISGDSVGALDQSLAQATGLISRVKQRLEAEIKLARVPAGAPPRRPPDLSSLSSREKIQYSIGGK